MSLCVCVFVCCECSRVSSSELSFSLLPSFFSLEWKVVNVLAVFLKFSFSMFFFHLYHHFPVSPSSAHWLCFTRVQHSDTFLNNKNSDSTTTKKTVVVNTNADTIICVTITTTTTAITTIWCHPFLFWLFWNFTLLIFITHPQTQWVIWCSNHLLHPLGNAAQFFLNQSPLVNSWGLSSLHLICTSPKVSPLFSFFLLSIAFLFFLFLCISCAK